MNPLRRLDLRPLDPVRSIKMKLGLLVVASVSIGATVTWYGLVILGLLPRFTVPIAILIALGTTLVLANGMTAPLRQMTAAARAMAAGQPAPAVPSVHTSSRDEVGELARAFTAMSHQLAAASEQRNELLANVGHELRTPVAALRAQLENLVDGVRPADQVALGEVLDQVVRLADLVRDLLDLARAEAGVTPLDRGSLGVAGLVQDVVRQVERLRPDRRIAIDVEPADLHADADRFRLSQVLTNLLDNASRHVSDGGRVTVRARPDGAGGLVLEVLDDGPGIPPERWEAVFDRFRQGTTGEMLLPALGPGADPGSGGTGLGLAIARWAVVLHGGSIRVLSTESGVGCRIQAVIPATAPPQ